MDEHDNDLDGIQIDHAGEVASFAVAICGTQIVITHYGDAKVVVIPIPHGVRLSGICPSVDGSTLWVRFNTNEVFYDTLSGAILARENLLSRNPEFWH